MAEAPKQVIAAPPQTYSVGYNQSIASGGWGSGPGTSYEVPAKHRRAGDVADNPVVGYLVSFNLNGGTVLVYDDSQVAGLVIKYTNPPVWIQTNSPIRIATVNATITVYVMAFYQIPNQ